MEMSNFRCLAEDRLPAYHFVDQSADWEGHIMKMRMKLLAHFCLESWHEYASLITLVTKLLYLGCY